MSRRSVAALVAAFLVFEALDVATLAALLGTPNGREANPLVEGLLVRLGLPFAVVAKAAVVTILLVAARVQHGDACRRVVLLVGVAAAMVGAASNLASMS